MSHSHTVK